MSKKHNRTIQLQAIDPTGISFDKTNKMSYYRVGWRNGNTPEEYPPHQEPMKQVRYLLSIGDYEYIVNRDGKITDVITGPDKHKFKID